MEDKSLCLLAATSPPCHMLESWHFFYSEWIPDIDQLIVEFRSLKSKLKAHGWITGLTYNVFKYEVVTMYSLLYGVMVRNTQDDRYP